MQEKHARQIKSLIANARRAMSEAENLMAEILEGAEPNRPHELHRNPISPARDERESRSRPLSFGPPNPDYMKPSRMHNRGRHGSRRRR